jgi:hypothetical protein
MYGHNTHYTLGFKKLLEEQKALITDSDFPTNFSAEFDENRSDCKIHTHPATVRPTNDGLVG